jgi:hypothetical protein
VKALALLAFTLAARTASAHPCGHGFVLGEEGPFCPQKGSGYWVPSLRLDFAAVARQVVLPAEDVSTSGLAPGTIETNGAAFRFHSGFHGFHGGGELIASWFDANARIAPSGDVMRASTQLDSAGRAVEVNFIGGYRQSTGPVLYGVEAAFGIRNMWRRNAGEDAFSAQGVVDARATAGIWLSPFVSLNAQIGTSLLRQDEHSAMLMLGFSVFPYDGLR